MELTQMSDAEIRAIADLIMDNLMAASTAIDHERHVRDFSDRARGVLSKDWFESVCAEYQGSKGVFGRREFVALFRRPESVAVVWKQWFTLAPGEYLAELVLVRKNGKYQVEHVMVL
jgi:hypothetical protein